MGVCVLRAVEVVDSRQSVDSIISLLLEIVISSPVLEVRLGWVQLAIDFQAGSTGSKTPDHADISSITKLDDWNLCLDQGDLSLS